MPAKTKSTPVKAHDKSAPVKAHDWNPWEMAPGRSSATFSRSSWSR